MRFLTKCATYTAISIAAVAVAAPAVASAAWNTTATGSGYAHAATLAAPTGLSVRCAAGTASKITFTLKWTDSATRGVNTQYTYGHAASTTAPTTWSSPTTISDNTTTQWADTAFNAAAKTKYWLAVQAAIHNGNGTWSSTIVSASYTTSTSGGC